MSPLRSTLLSALTFTTLTLCSAIHPIHASPLPPSHPHLEQELNSLTPHPPPEDDPSVDVPDSLNPSPSDIHEETFEDVLQHDQDISENAETEDDSPAESIAGKQWEREAENPSYAPSENPDDLESLSALIQEEQFQPLNIYHANGPKEELRSLDSDNRNSQDRGLQRMQTDSQEDEEEAEWTGQEVDEDAVRQLDSLIPAGRDSSRSSEEYDGYDADQPDSWMEVDDDEKADESSRPFQTQVSPPYFDDVIAPGDVDAEGHNDVKRGERVMEVEGYPPLRVIVLNDTVYLNNTEDDHLPKFQPVPMPDKFEDYDVNGDGVISLPELRYVTRATEGVRMAFRDADTDGDGWVDREEFQGAGWGLPVDSVPPSPPQET